MPINPVTRLSILTFPQSWDGNSLTVRFLCLPKGNPLTDPFKPGLPAFAAANLVFEPKLIGSLDRLPLPADAAPADPLPLDEPPTQKAELFGELTKLFKIVPRGVPRPQAQFRKVITESYRSLIGDRRRSPLLADASEFHCALHQGAVDQPAEPVPPTDDVTWGRLIAFVLRQPKLATALGLMGQATVTLDDPTFFANGGWLYIDLHPTSDYAGETERTALYAARLPKLTGPRSLFAAVLFPVSGAPDFVADDVAREAQLYDDGIAKLVHCAQGDGAGDSIQLGWEDEQIAEWLHRQVQVTPGGGLKLDAPNGVAGYRVDVRKAGNEDWNSLLRIKSQGDLEVGDLSLGSFQGEGIIEVAPAQVSPKQPGMFWLPPYFASWRGSSLALTDADLTNLHARLDVPDVDAATHLLNREKVFVPVDDKAVPLEYGQTYEFRVRLADLTRGGPDAKAPLPNPPRNSVASLTFQRRKAPGPVEIIQRPRADSRQVLIAKPKLGYPEALFTGQAVFNDLELDLNFLAANPKVTREIGVPDPDVVTLEIQVEVKSLRGDKLPYLPLYRTTRAFVGPELTITLDFQEKHATLLTFDGEQPKEGSLALPTARDLRLTFAAIGRDQAGYFVNEKARQGAPVTLDVRAPGSAEPELLSDPPTFASLRSFFFQPPPPGNAVSPPAERLAAEIGLDHSALTLSGRAGRRTVIACSAQLHHTLTPESSAITFSSSADLVQRWINVLQFTVARDWTWDGLDPAGIKVTRVVHFPMGPDSVETAGVIRLPRVIGPRLAAGAPADARAPIRQSTDLIFIDAFDPKPAPPLKPSELTVDYILEPAFEGLPPVIPLARSILLPVTTPPSKAPRIVSAGIALSDYEAAGDYSSTKPRRRMLWFQFDAEPTDPGDAYFVRVLAKAPDPMMLLPDEQVSQDLAESPLPIDPEWMRMITPGQPKDENGLAAMQQLEDSPTPGFHLVPLPPELQEASAELFGFFVYEVRLGHKASRWSTAQGRYGPLLRIAGVQHPPPPLVCQAGRDKTGILVQAPFATPVLNGVNLRPFIPQTDLWALLYARVRQADGAAWRNVVLARKQLFALHAGNDPERAGIPVIFGEAVFDVDTVASSLGRLGLPPDEPLTVLAAELFANPRESDPLGQRLGQARMLRISPLVPVPDAC